MFTHYKKSVFFCSWIGIVIVNLLSAVKKKCNKFPILCLKRPVRRGEPFVELRLEPEGGREATERRGMPRIRREGLEGTGGGAWEGVGQWGRAGR